MCSRIMKTRAYNYPMAIDNLVSKLNAAMEDIEIALDDVMIGSSMSYLHPIDEYDIGFQTYERHLDLLQYGIIVHSNNGEENPKLMLHGY